MSFKYRRSLFRVLSRFSSAVAKATEHMETPKPRPPQASVVNESELGEGRIYHRYAEDKRERVEAGSLHV